MSDPQIRQIQPEELSGLPVMEGPIPHDEATFNRCALELLLVTYEETLKATEQGKLVTALDVCQLLSGLCHHYLDAVKDDLKA